MNIQVALHHALRVLLVDDVLAVRRVMRRLLGELGITDVTEAQNGAEAIDLLNAASFDVVIADCTMPIIGGFELVEIIRADDRFRTLPFIMVTVSVSREHEMQAAKSGVSAYISKPFTVDMLKAKLEQVLPSSSDEMS